MYYFCFAERKRVGRTLISVLPNRGTSGELHHECDLGWPGHFLGGDIQLLLPKSFMAVGVAKQGTEFCNGKKRRSIEAADRAVSNALSKLGLDYKSPPSCRGKGSLRSWPKGYGGSVAYSRDWVIAIVVKASNMYRSIGVDIEAVSGRGGEVSRSLRNVKNHCAQEASYKACQDIDQHFDFTRFGIEFFQGSNFVGSYESRHTGKRVSTVGRITLVDNYVIATATLDRNNLRCLHPQFNA